MAATTSAETAEFNLLQAFATLLRYRRFLLGITVGAFLLSTLYAYLVRPVYTATTRLVVPRSQSSPMLGAAGDLLLLAGKGLDAAGGEMYVEIARSRSVAEPLIDRFDLLKSYGVTFREDAYVRLNREIDARFDQRAGILSLAVSDRDPARAAALANALAGGVKLRVIEMNTGSAGQEREFLAERLDQVGEALRRAEESMKLFQEENRAFRLDDQALATVERLGRLRGELASKEIAAGVLRTAQTERNPELRALLNEIAQIRRQIEQIERTPAGRNVQGNEPVTAGELPALGVRYARLVRDYKIQETLFNQLTKQLEAVHTEEVKVISPLQVLDEAVVPERRSSPKRMFVVTLATSSALLLALLAILVREGWQRMIAGEPELWTAIRAQLRWR